MVKIYVDGSFIDGKVGYGAVLLEKDKIITEISGSVSDKNAVSSRQVAGELEAVRESLLYCQKNNINTVEVYYDYKGIECWATGSWKTNKDLTKSYKDFILKIKKDISIKWKKVAAHSGNKWNDFADNLAKRGALKSRTAGSKVDVHKAAVRNNPSLAGEAEKVLNNFIKELDKHNISSKYMGIKNDMYGRIEIIEDSKKVGIVDLYNTKNKKLSPDFRGFKDQEFKSEIEKIWDNFKKKIS